MKFSKKWIGIAAAAVLLLAAAVTAAVALPQTASAHGSPGGMAGLAWFGGSGTNTYLADALGITTDELATAQQSAFDAALTQAVDQGLITQAQADAVKARGMDNFGLLQHFSMFGGQTIDVESLLANALNISVDQLHTAEQNAYGAMLDQAVTNGRLTQAQADQMKARNALQGYLNTQGLQAKIQALVGQAVQDAVKAGVITQDQADQFLNNNSMNGMGLRGFGNFGPGGFGFEGRHGGRGFGMRGFGGRGFAPPSGNGTTNGTTTQSLYRF